MIIETITQDSELVVPMFCATKGQPCYEKEQIKSTSAHVPIQKDQQQLSELHVEHIYNYLHTSGSA
jgi:hypothetical protein